MSRVQGRQLGGRAMQFAVVVGSGGERGGGHCRGKRGQSGFTVHPLRISTALQSSIVGRDG